MVNSTVFVRAQVRNLAQITVRLWKGERDSIYGEIILPDEASAELAITVSGPKSPAEVLAVAAVLARRLEHDIAVVDYENLWNPTWGALT